MLALIPARGGSKRLPGKNLRLLGGIPLIAHTIQQALAAPGISRVIVNTDCEHIAKVSLSYGAEIPFLRPAHLATDAATSIEVFKHAFQELSTETMVVLQPTSPLREVTDIVGAIKLFEERDADGVVSCMLASPFNWHLLQAEDGTLSPLLANTETGSHFPNTLLLPNGSIYIIKNSVIVERGTYLSGKSYAYLMRKSSSVDIDTLDDFQMAEAVYLSRIQQP